MVRNSDPVNYLVRKDCQPWRLGMVFVQELYDERIGCVEEITNCHDARIEVLSLHDGFIGLLNLTQRSRECLGANRRRL